MGQVAHTEDDVVGSVHAGLVAHFGHEPDSASVSFVGVDPISVLRFRVGDLLVYVTSGMSASPLPEADPDMVVHRDVDGPRAELLLRVRANTLGADEVWRRLALLGAAPVVEGLRYADGAVVAFGEPIAPGSRARGVVVAESGLAVPAGGRSVTVFEVVPATADELAWARVHGVPALRARWTEQDVDLTDLGRAQVGLG